MTFHPACEKEVSTYIMKGSKGGGIRLLVADVDRRCWGW